MNAPMGIDGSGILVSLAAALAVVLAALAFSLIWLRRQPSWRRVLALGNAARSAKPRPLPHVLRDKLSGLLARISKPAKPKQGWQLSKLRRDLMLAGFRSPSAVNVYLGLRTLSILIMPAIMLLTPLTRRIEGSLLPMFLVMAAGLGYLLPSFILEAKSRRRRDGITRELPDVLDLLVISVEAGLGLDAAIRRVADETKLSAPVLASELHMVSLELKAGIPRDMALKNLGARCGVDDVTSLVAMLNQADRFGVSVGRSLRVHSDTVRTKRRQKVEEAAAKVPLKLLFPVLFMIFPAIMVVMAGPAIIRVGETMMK